MDGCKKKKKTELQSGCGIVIKGADGDRWITVSKILVPLGVCSALSAEVSEACILANVLDLIFRRNFCIENIDLCIDDIIRRQKTNILGD